MNISLFDDQSFFARTLYFGVRHGLIDQTRLDAMQSEGAKGMVQIARHFDTEFLRPSLELARDRLVHFISLYLEDNSAGDLTKAAQLLRDHSLLALSKGGADLLRALLALPGRDDLSRFEHDLSDKALLMQWSLVDPADYHKELEKRRWIQLKMAAAYWFAQQFELARNRLDDAPLDTDSASVVRSGLLLRAVGLGRMASRQALIGVIAELRKKHLDTVLPQLQLPANLPPRFESFISSILDSMRTTELPLMLDPAIKIPALFARLQRQGISYFILDEALDDVLIHETQVSEEWQNLTQGHTDEGSLLTLFVNVAAGRKPAISISQAQARKWIRELRQSALNSAAVIDFIEKKAPHERQDDFKQLWQSFVEAVLPDLQNQRDAQLVEALRALKNHCHVEAVTKSKKTASAQRR